MNLDAKLKDILEDYQYKVEANRQAYEVNGTDDYKSILKSSIEKIKLAVTKDVK